MKITSTNVFVLAKHADAGFPPRVDAGSLNHLRRCIKTGLLLADAHGQRLSPEGQAAVDAERALWARK